MADRVANTRAGDWIADAYRSLDYDVWKSGPYANIVAIHPECPPGPRVLIGSHYDTVPGTPGADDNASAVGVSLACARALTLLPNPRPVMFVSFNREEDGLLGSRQFVEESVPSLPEVVGEAHILEMVGYCCHESDSQRLPKGLPVRVPDVGDFLALLGNRTSNRLIKPLLRTSASAATDLRVLGIRVYLGLERYFPHLLRSDHAPFWQAGVPAIMWTDTSEFRNPHYHLPSDTPDTLDYSFMRR